MIGSDFRKSVWNILFNIEYGQTILTGYAAGIEKKMKLLQIENSNCQRN